jgi:formylglycine-generating enzyme required for sulfatase activity
MLPEKYQWIAAQFEPEGDPWLLFEIALQLEREGSLEAAATVYDRAYGISPTAELIQLHRRHLLDQLAITEHGIRFRYIPEGVFLMGCEQGEPDERPWHPVWLSPYWLSETPISWAAYCRLMGWEAPPVGAPLEQPERGAGFDTERFTLYNENKIRLQYCEDHTTRAWDWHSHLPPQAQQPGVQQQAAQAHFRPPPRDDPNAPWQYENKPMVAVSWLRAMELAERLTTSGAHYSLPTEAQWEKAARGGLIGARHAWGDEKPATQRCDFGRFGEFSIQPMTRFAPNGYGLFAVNGCVWEWVRDWYDRDYYRQSPEHDPEGPAQGQGKVLRGGSWADCAEVVTVTFRMAFGTATKPGEKGGNGTPNIGFRLCRTVASR